MRFKRPHNHVELYADLYTLFELADLDLVSGQHGKDDAGSGRIGRTTIAHRCRAYLQCRLSFRLSIRLPLKKLDFFDLFGRKDGVM